MTSPASLASSEATPGDPVGELVRRVREGTRGLTEQGLRDAAEMHRVLAQVYEDAADERVG